MKEKFEDFVVWYKGSSKVVQVVVAVVFVVFVANIISGIASLF